LPPASVILKATPDVTRLLEADADGDRQAAAERGVPGEQGRHPAQGAGHRGQPGGARRFA